MVPCLNEYGAPLCVESVDGQDGNNLLPCAGALPHLHETSEIVGVEPGCSGGGRCRISCC